MPRASTLWELARLFLKLGTIGFGGPAAHIALMEDEVVRRRAWMSRAEFMDLVGATNLIPGPNSTELAIHIGRHRAGTAGLLVAGAAFIVPAVLIVSVLAWAYTQGASLPAVSGPLSGIKPIVLAIVVRALWRLRHAVLKHWFLATMAACVCVAVLIWPRQEVALLLAAGAVSAVAARAGASTRGTGAAGGWMVAVSLAPAAAPATAAGVSLPALFLAFAKMGALLFGSGYVLIAFLRTDLVERLGWLTNAQLLDAIAVGQITPGPLFTTATFIGYLLAGWPGAIVATVGIFLPAFVFVAATAPVLAALRRSATLGAGLDGVNAASLALMAAVTGQLAASLVFDVPSAVLCAIAFVLLGRGVNAAWVIAGGAAAGLMLY